MGLEDVGVRLVVEGEQQYQAALKAAQNSNSGFSTSVEKTGTQSTQASKGIDKMGASAKSSGAYMKELEGFTIALNQGLELAQKAFELVSGALEKTVGYTIDYGEQVRNLTLLSGESAEESSRLIRVADDLGVSYDQLKMSVKAMAKEGISPSIEQLATMSDEFLKIQDPAARDEFLLKNLGKAGLDMADFMSQGGDAIRQASANMEQSLILTDKDIAATHEAELGKREFNDAMEAIALSLGKTLLPAVAEILKKGKEFLDWLNGAINLGKNATEAQQAQSKAVALASSSYDDYTKKIVENYHQQIKAAAASGDLIAQTRLQILEENILKGQDIAKLYNLQQMTLAEYAVTNAQGVLNTELDQYNKKSAVYISSMETATAQQRAAIDSTGDLARANAFAKQSAADLQAAEDAQKAATDILTGSMNELTRQTLYQAASEGMSTDQKLRLAEAMGLVNRDSLDYLTAVNDLKNMMENGYITVEEYNKRVTALADSYDRLHSKDLTITTTYIEIHKNGGTVGAGGAKGQYASGGSWMIGPGFENEGYRFPDGRTASSGEMVTVTPAPPGATTVSAGPITYNYSNTVAYNLSVMTNQSPQVVQHSFALMKLLAG